MIVQVTPKIPKWIFYATALMISSAGCVAQEQSSTEESYDDLKTWALRTGIGIQKSPYFEIGLSRIIIPTESLSFSSNAFYTSVEINRRQHYKSPYCYGFKAGYEGSWALLMFALEAKYISDFKNKETFLVTPKVGASLMGGVNLLYGYNFPKDLNSFPGIGNHQFSLIIHLSPKLKKAFLGERTSAREN